MLWYYIWEKVPNGPSKLILHSAPESTAIDIIQKQLIVSPEKFSKLSVRSTRPQKVENEMMMFWLPLTRRMSSSSDDEEEDSVAKETQKEIIIARDLTIEKLTKEGEALNTRFGQ